MELLLIGSIILAGGLFSLFDGTATIDEAPANPDSPGGHPGDSAHGGGGNDSLSADSGLLSGWGGDDLLTLSGTAHGYGNEGHDTIEAQDSSVANGGLGMDSLSGVDVSQSYGGDGNDFLDINGNAGGWGGAGDDSLVAGTYAYVSGSHATIYGGEGDDRLTADAGAAYGDQGNDVLLGDGSLVLGYVPALYGGAGNDTLFAAENTTAHGDDGNDVISLGYGAKGYGGAGDDVLILTGAGTHSFGTDTDQLEATGGAGHDTFAINLVEPSAYSTVDPMVITDFDPTQDHLVVESAGGELASYVFDHASSIEHADLGYTDVTLHWHSTDPAQTPLTNRLRLQGVTGFDPASIDLVSTISGQPQASIGALLQAVNGSAAADTFSGQSNAFVTTGAGNDVVSTAAKGQVVADLGAGDDRFVAIGAAHIVYGGEGADSYLVDAPKGVQDLPPSDGIQGHAFFDGGAGNDTITIKDDGATSNLTVADHAIFQGGDGNDRLEAMAGTGPLSLNGGAGSDTLIGRAGQSFNAGEADDQSRDDLTLNITSSEVVANGAAQIRLLGDDRLTINIDPELKGAITFVYHTAGNGSEVNRTDIVVGRVTVAVVTEGLPLIEEAISLNDSRLVINRI